MTRRPWAVLFIAAAGLVLVAACGPAVQHPTHSVESVPVPGEPVTGGSMDAFIGNGVTSAPSGSFGLDRATFVSDSSAPGGRVLRVRYPAGSASPDVARRKGGVEGGTQAYLKLPLSTDALTLSYGVRFPVGFQFVKGGKLPGLYGGTGGSGGTHHDDGFSTRFMWRGGAAGELYAYLPGGTGYGDSIGRGSWHFTPGRWNHITQRVQLNTPGQPNGSVTVWLDGRQVFNASNLSFRADPSLHVDGIFFSTFFGGDDNSWASPIDQYADFAGFAITG